MINDVNQLHFGFCEVFALLVWNEQQEGQEETCGNERVLVIDLNHKRDYYQGSSSRRILSAKVHSKYHIFDSYGLAYVRLDQWEHFLEHSQLLNHESVMSAIRAKIE